MATVQVVGLVLDLRKLHVAEVLDDVVTVVGMVALLGYAFGRAVGKRRFWMISAVLFPLSNAAVGVWVYPRNATGTRIDYFAAMLLFLPQYLGVALYAYRSHALWEGHDR